MTCKTYSVASASNTTTATAAQSIIPNGSGVSQTTTVLFNTVNSGDVLQLNFSGPTTTIPAYTCSYTCSKSSCTANGNKYTYKITQPDATCP